MGGGKTARTQGEETRGSTLIDLVGALGPRRGASQDLRGQTGPGRLRPRSAARHRLRPARSQRRGQDHRRAHPGLPRAARQRPGDCRGTRRDPRTPRGAPQDRTHRTARGRRRDHHSAAEPGDVRPPLPPRCGARPAAGDRTPRPVRADGGGGPPAEGLQRRYAPEARSGLQHDPRPRGAVPGRADHRPGPARQERGVGGRARPHGGGHDGGAHHPLPGRGRQALRPHSRDRPGPQRHRGHPGRAQAGDRRGPHRGGRRRGARHTRRRRSRRAGRLRRRGTGDRQRGTAGPRARRRGRPGTDPGGARPPGRGHRGGGHRIAPPHPGRGLLDPHRRAGPTTTRRRKETLV